MKVIFFTSAISVYFEKTRLILNFKCRICYTIFMKQDLINQFFDINKLPKNEGILLFPISLSRVDAGQTPKNCLEYLRIFTPDKILIPRVGANFVYGDFLYLHSQEPGAILKNRFMNNIVQHKNGLFKLIEKNHIDFQIQDAFHFQTWNDYYLQVNDFIMKFQELKIIFNNDKIFQSYLREDLKLFERKYTEDNINFFLEEHLMFYMISKGLGTIPNKYINNKDKWRLWCYPGKPMKHYVYLHQLNPFNLENSENPYQNSWYDLESKKLYDFERLDLKTWNYE